MLPRLPSEDPNLAARAAALEQERARYRFDRSIGGLPLAAEVPKGEGYSVAYVARATGVEARLKEARLKAARDPRLAGAREAWEAELDVGRDGMLGAVVARAEDAEARGPLAAPLVFASTVADFVALRANLPAPLFEDVGDLDAFFAWQRVAGCNPAGLQRQVEADPRFPVSEAHFAAAVDDPADGLARARSEGRLYVLDLTALHGLATRPSYGFERYLYGPLALFVRTLDGPLRPVAIQVGPDPSEHAIFTRADGAAWRHAQLLVQASDAVGQGLSEHLGMCHVFANAVLLCTARELAPSHPVRLLLWPHFEMTLAANETMKTAVIGEGGFVDELQGPALEVGIALAAGACRRSVRDHLLRRDLERRGVADRDALPDYPYRDDALALHDALEPWMRDYVRLYYTSADDVRADPELAAWHASLAADDGAGLVDLPALDLEGLVELLVAVVFRITGYHAVINYGCYDFYAWPPTLPTARWGPAPSPDVPLDDLAILRVLPPLGLAQRTFDLVLPQRELRLNALGHYPAFADPRVAPLVEALRARLDDVEAGIAERDARRPWSFPYLRPSRVAQSIHV